MKFTILCPVDGEMTVGLDNIENMVVHSEGKADITFKCPKCGTHIAVTAPVPPFLVETMQSISRDLGIPLEGGNVVFNHIADLGEDPFRFRAGDEQVDYPQYRERKLTAREQSHLDFFRYELDSVRSVSDLLADEPEA